MSATAKDANLNVRLGDLPVGGSGGLLAEQRVANSVCFLGERWVGNKVVVMVAWLVRLLDAS